MLLLAIRYREPTVPNHCVHCSLRHHRLLTQCWIQFSVSVLSDQASVGYKRLRYLRRLERSIPCQFSPECRHRRCYFTPPHLAAVAAPSAVGTEDGGRAGLDARWIVRLFLRFLSTLGFSGFALLSHKEPGR